MVRRWNSVPSDAGDGATKDDKCELQHELWKKEPESTPDYPACDGKADKHRHASLKKVKQKHK
jgi:hypothetical protein